MLFQEDESPTPSPTKSLWANNDQRHLPTGELHSAVLLHSSHDDSRGSDEGSDVEVRRPVGRAARRMLGAALQSVPRLEYAPPPSTLFNAQNSDDELYTSTPRKNRPTSSAHSPSVPASAVRSALFVSPAASTPEEHDDELPRQPLKSRLAELVAQKRAERLANENDANEGSIAAHASDFPNEILEGHLEPADLEVERIMSDAVKPTRKASKRAMLEMERETQRLSRQQGLTHDMKVRKKFTTVDLFARFNFQPDGESPAPVPVAVNVHTDATVSPAFTSDGIETSSREPVSTPPSSPPTPMDRQKALVEQGALSKMVLVREDSLVGIRDQFIPKDLPLQPPDESKVKDGHVQGRASGSMERPKRGLKIARLGKRPVNFQDSSSSDDELDIVQSVSNRLRVFDKAKGWQKNQHVESAAIHTLRHLSHIGADHGSRKARKGVNLRPSLNPRVLEAQLRMQAKAQAREQQLERIAELKAKGIEIQTSEEREREQEDFENLLEKARQDAVELRKAEKAAAKGDGGAGNDEGSGADSEDDDYVDVSGSEADGGDDDEKNANELVDDLADEIEDEEMESDGEDDDREDGEKVRPDASHGTETHESDIDEAPPVSETVRTPTFNRKARRPRLVLDDEDESDMDGHDSLQHKVVETTSHDTNIDDPFAAFNFAAAKAGSSLMSPTQAFNATLQTPTQATEDESQDVFRRLMPPTVSSLPSLSQNLDTLMQYDSQTSIVHGSQPANSQVGNAAWETQTPDTPRQAIDRRNSDLTLETPGWQPTQDMGLQSQATPISRHDRPHDALPANSTQSTVLLRVSESPAAPIAKRRRLVQGQRGIEGSSDEDDEVVEARIEIAPKNAFHEMARKRKAALSAAELAEAERETKEMMDEQAEESEDEYAGLGGDDYIAPENEQDREIIDSSHVEVDEQALAAHFAERQRIADEAAANKLYKDLMTGGLRRKQANIFDLDDDEDDLALRRRQMKQREEARKRKLLLQDENIAGLAQGKHSMGKDAFLKAIADDDDRDDDVADLSEVEGEQDTQPSQSGTQQSREVEPLQEISGNKRRAEEMLEDRLPAKQRRTEASAFRAPRSLLEIQESVSFLLDEPHVEPIGPSVLEPSSDAESETHEREETDEADEETELQNELARQNDGGFAPDRIAMPPPRLPASQRRTASKSAAATVVDRLSLRRATSASEGASHGRSAWAAPAAAGFRIPSLLRRATTHTTLGANERGVTTAASLPRENSAGVKMGGTKRSSLAYQARAEERRAIVEASAKRRQESTARIAQLRHATSGGFGKGFGGRFE